MNMHIKNNLEELPSKLWNFIHDFQVGNISDMQIDMTEGIAIHKIIEAADFINNHKTDLYKLLNNTLE